MRPQDAARLERARAHFPRLFAGTAFASPALAAVRPAHPTFLACVDAAPAEWREHLVPPGATAPKMVRRALADAMRQINRQRARQRTTLEQWLARTDPQAEAQLAAVLQRRLDHAPAPFTLAEMLEHSSVQTFAINTLADGTPMQAILVNMVYKTPLRGSFVYVPWAEDAGERVFALGPTAVQRNLVGIVTPQSASTSTAAAAKQANRRPHAPRSQQAQYARQFRISYRVPSSCNNDINPAQLKIQETAAMSTDIGYLTVKATTALMARFCHVPTLRITRRHCDNRVYVTYLRPTIDLAVLVQRGRTVSCDTKRTRFGGTVMWHPRFGKMKMLVFPTGVIICVGAKSTQTMRQAMDFFLPIIDASRAPLASSPAAPLALPPERTTDAINAARALKRRRADRDNKARTTKRARTGQHRV